MEEKEPQVRTTRHRTPLGSYVVPESWDSDTIVKDIKSGVLHGWRVAEAIVRWWDPGTAILDVGCNLGQMSVCVARGTQRLAEATDLTRIHGIEAREALADLARQNMNLNAIDGSVVWAAAWDEPDVRLPLTDISFSDFDSVGSLGVDRVNASTSDSAPSVVIDSCEFDQRVSVLKLDIQGSEYRALVGAREFIMRHAPVIIFEFEEMFAPQFDVDFSDYVDLLASFNYRIREVCGSNNYVAISDSRFAEIYSHEFSTRRRRMNRDAFFELVRE